MNYIISMLIAKITDFFVASNNWETHRDDENYRNSIAHSDLTP